MAGAGAQVRAGGRGLTRSPGHRAWSLLSGPGGRSCPAARAPGTQVRINELVNDAAKCNDILSGILTVLSLPHATASLAKCADKKQCG